MFKKILAVTFGAMAILTLILIVIVMTEPSDPTAGYIKNHTFREYFDPTRYK